MTTGRKTPKALIRCGRSISPALRRTTFVKRPLLALACHALLVTLPAHAQQSAPPSPAAQIGALMKAGNYDEALQRADARLKDSPRDAQVRFMRGVILTEQGKTIEASSVFEALIAEFPELPEPYNNLAVLHAAQGRYESAFRLLQQSLAAQPNYVTAYENLGDLHLSMAEAAYGKALELDAHQRTAKAKLAIARELTARIRAVR